MTAGIVIVGTGHCGVSAAYGARMAGFQGPITLIGDEAELPYERPPLSKWEAGPPALRAIFAEDWYQSHDITLRRATHVTGIDRTRQTVALSSGDTYPYAKLLLATGASARLLPPDMMPGVRLRYVRTFADAQALAQDVTAGADVLIVGGGFIGLELAASLAARKAFVHVVEAQDRILARAVAPAIAQKIQQLHGEHGVTLHTGASVHTVENGVAVLSSGQSVRAEHVIVGIGSVPNTDLAAHAGLAVDNGIIVDENFTTQDPNILAAGDCCAVPVAGAGRARFESWQVAGDQGVRAGQVMAGTVPEPSPPPWFWSDQFDHTLQVVGVPSDQHDHILRPLPDGGLIALQTRAGGQISYAAGFAPGQAVGRDIKIIQKMMEADLSPDPMALADPDTSLKSILRQRERRTHT